MKSMKGGTVEVEMSDLFRISENVFSKNIFLLAQILLSCQLKGLVFATTARFYI